MSRRRPQWRRWCLRQCRLGLTLLAITLLISAHLWQPGRMLRAQLQTVRETLASEQADALRLGQLVREGHALQKQAVPPRLPASKLPAALLRLAEAHGLDPDDWQLTPQAGGVHLSGRVAFDAWLPLLAELQARHAIRVSELNLQAVAPGLVQVEALLSPAAP